MPYDNSNQGALFKNAKKQQDRDPDYTGQAQVDGVEYWLDAWINEIKNGEKAGQKFMKLRFKPKQQRSGGGGREPGDEFPC